MQLSILRRHIIAVHEGKKINGSSFNESANQDKENSRNRNKNFKKLHQCKFCNKTFRRGSAVKQHEEICKEMKNENLMESKSTVKFELVEREPIKCEPISYESKRIKPKYVCEYCEKKCLSPYSLKCHKRIHTGEKPYSCSFCTIKFRQIIHVQGHERVHVTKGHVRKYSESDMIHFCKACSKDFIGPENLRKHQEIHGNTVCPTCGKEFSAPSKLEKHKMIHSGEKPFSCNYCTVKFRSKGNVRIHEKLHIARGHKIQKNESKMLHFCQYCNKDIIGQKAFLNHKKLHTKNLESIVFNPIAKSYSCKLCNMKISNKCNLKRHIAGVHEGKKAFKCSACNACFSDKFNLARHVEKKHEGKK